MCAKKATPAAATAKATSSKKTIPLTKPVTVAAGKAAANGKMAKSAAPVAAKGERLLSEHAIGEVAGEVWSLLASGDAQTLAVIKKGVSASPDVIAAAIGWLAREHKLEFVTSGRTLKVGLKR